VLRPVSARVDRAGRPVARSVARRIGVLLLIAGLGLADPATDHPPPTTAPPAST
jgi:hypothetical protein